MLAVFDACTMDGIGNHVALIARNSTNIGNTLTEDISPLRVEKPNVHRHCISDPRAVSIPTKRQNPMTRRCSCTPLALYSASVKDCSTLIRKGETSGLHNQFLICLVIVLLSLPALAHTEPQRRRAGSNQRRATRPTTTARTTRADTAELDEARTRLTDQIKLLSRFLYLYGRISGTIEASERDGDGGRAAEQSRDALITNIRNVRAGLEDLAERFNRTPSLTRYTAQVIGAGDLARQAESSIAAGNLDEAGRSMVAAVGSLTDALAAMR